MLTRNILAHIIDEISPPFFDSIRNTPTGLRPITGKHFSRAYPITASQSIQSLEGSILDWVEEFFRRIYSGNDPRAVSLMMKT